MRLSIHRLVLIFIVLSPLQAVAIDNIVLVTIDGLRWQEVFRGMEKRLVEDERFTERRDTLMDKYWADNPEARADRLLPYLHQQVFEEGVVVGNRDRGSCAKVANPWYFSYPGYNEILTGVVDPSIDTNDKIPNPNKTFMELLTDKKTYKGKMAAFASWDVFPFIYNRQRSGIHVNAYETVAEPDRFEAVLNRLQGDIPSPWATVRLDAFTHHYAREYIKQHKPRIIHLAYGETDDFAHDGQYDQYIMAAHRTDRFIGEIWDTINRFPQYQGKTGLFITVDHGRGEEPVETWQHHASRAAVQGYISSLAEYEAGIEGSDNIWMAAMGPGIPSRGLVTTGGDCLTADRVAATLLHWLGEDYRDLNPDMGEPLPMFLPQ